MNAWIAAVGLLATPAPAEGAEPIVRDLFPPEAIHNHASCLAEAPDGTLIAAWYRGSGERTADDVQIMGARLRPGADAWEPRFVMADTPGYPDCNPAVFVSPAAELWLFYPTILDHRWEGALLKYAVAADPAGTGPPTWRDRGVLHVTPTDLGPAIGAALDRLDLSGVDLRPGAIDEIRHRAGEELYQRLGWMPRVRPLVLRSGRWLLPLYTDTFSASLVAYTDDGGGSWRFSTPMIAYGNIQPSLVERADGTVVAYMRDNGPWNRIAVAESADGGATWGEVRRSDLPNPGSGVDAIRLASGAWALVHNDLDRGRHSLAVSVSDDEGRTWPIRRHLERSAPGGPPAHYPSILQGRDGRVHVSYTFGNRGSGSTIRHASFEEAWLRRPEGAPE